MARTHLRAAPRALLGAVIGSLAGACQYDIDKLYRYADAKLDASVEQVDAAVEAPAQLIELFGALSASEECVACANEKCGDENEACRADETCTAFTACLAEDDTPAQREDCRERYRDWLGEPRQLFARDVSGPFLGCVLQQRCDTECGTRSDLACLGDYAWPSTSQMELSYRLRLADTNSRAVAGVEVRVCDANVPEFCTDQARVVSDADGIVDLTLPVSATGAFSGYFEIKKDGELHESLLRLGWPVARSGVTNVTVIPEVLFQVLSGLGPVVAEETRGMLQLRMTGCSGWPVRGIRYSVDGQADDETIVSWYTGDQTGQIVPSFTAASTDDLGAGGVINVPPGSAIVRAEREADGLRISEVIAPIRQNALTVVVLTPGPAP